jgi:hypothetical protein
MYAPMEQAGTASAVKRAARTLHCSAHKRTQICIFKFKDIVTEYTQLSQNQGRSRDDSASQEQMHPE